MRTSLFLLYLLILSTSLLFQAPLQAQAQPDFKEWLADENRILNVCYPLFCIAGTFQNSKELSFGFTLHDKKFYSTHRSPQFQKWISKHFNLKDNGVFVRYIHPDSQAYRSGISVSDKIYALNGKPCPSTAKEAMEMISQHTTEQKTLKLAIVRDGIILFFDIEGLATVNYPIRLSNQYSLELESQDGTFVLSRTLLKELKSDHELALMISYLISKEALKDSELQGRDWEDAVDELALRMASRAGFRIEHADKLWARLAGTEDKPRLSPLSLKHPSDTYRLRLIKSISNSIENPQSFNSETLN